MSTQIQFWNGICPICLVWNLKLHKKTLANYHWNMNDKTKISQMPKLNFFFWYYDFYLRAISKWTCCHTYKRSMWLDSLFSFNLFLTKFGVLQTFLPWSGRSSIVLDTQWAEKEYVCRLDWVTRKASESFSSSENYIKMPITYLAPLKSNSLMHSTGIGSYEPQVFLTQLGFENYCAEGLTLLHW